MERTKVLVVWHDAHSASDGWCAVGDVDASPCRVQSLGWLIPDAKPDHVTVAQSVSDDDALDSLLCVPVGMVVSVQIL